MVAFVEHFRVLLREKDCYILGFFFSFAIKCFCRDEMISWLDLSKRFEVSKYYVDYIYFSLKLGYSCSILGNIMVLNVWKNYIIQDLCYIFFNFSLV